MKISNKISDWLKAFLVVILAALFLSALVDIRMFPGLFFLCLVSCFLGYLVFEILSMFDKH